MFYFYRYVYSIFGLILVMTRGWKLLFYNVKPKVENMVHFNQ